MSKNSLLQDVSIVVSFFILSTLLSILMFRAAGEEIANYVFVIFPLIALFFKKHYLKPKALISNRQIFFYDWFFAAMLSSYIFFYLINIVIRRNV